MAITMSRRDLLYVGRGTAAALGVLVVAGELAPARAQQPLSNEPKEELFYREDWFGEPWRKPETAVLIHGNDESSLVWYGWLPRMGQEFRLIRPDLP
jgi:pimeloyl-ACP methyl ester carboxylesterase